MVPSSLSQILLICFSFLLSVYSNEDDPFYPRHFKPVTFNLENIEVGGDGVKKETYTANSQQVKEIRDCFIKDFITADTNFPNLNSILEVGTKCIIKVVHPYNKIEWVSFDNEKAELKNRKYRKYKIKVNMGDVQYISRPEIAPQPDILAVKWIHNRQQDANISSVVSDTISREEKTSVKTTHSYGGSITAGFSVSFVSVSVSVGYKGSQTSTEEITAVKTYSLEDTVKVAPKNSVKITWNLIEQESVMDWKAPMNVTGAAAIKFYSNSYSHDIRFLPLGELAKFFKEFRSIGDDIYTLQADIDGVLQSSKGITSTVRTFHFPMNPNDQGLMIGECPNGAVSS